MQATDEANLEGAADADVPAEEGQVKEKGVGVIFGQAKLQGRVGGEISDGWRAHNSFPPWRNALAAVPSP